MWSQRSSFDCLRNQGSVPLSAWSTASVRSTAPGLRGSHFGAGLETRTRGHTALETGTRKILRDRPGKISRRPSLPITTLGTSILRLHPESGFAGQRSRPRGQGEGGEVLESRLLPDPSQKLGTTCPRLLQFIRDSIPTQLCSGTTKLGGARLTRMKE